MVIKHSTKYSRNGVSMHLIQFKYKVRTTCNGNTIEWRWASNDIVTFIVLQLYISGWDGPLFYVTIKHFSDMLAEKK